MKPFAFIVAFVFALFPIHAYACPAYAGPLGASTALTLIRFRFQLRRSGSPGGGTAVTSAETGSAILVTATTLSSTTLILL